MFVSVVEIFSVGPDKLVEKRNKRSGGINRLVVPIPQALIVLEAV